MKVTETEAPTAPLYLWDPDDLCIFNSIEEAQSWLEPIDVKNGVRFAYDAEGRRLKVEVELVTDSLLVIKWSKEIVRIRLLDPNDRRPEELRQILIAALCALSDVDEDPELSDLPLKELQERALKRFEVGRAR